MTFAADLDLPSFESDDVSLTGDRLHATLRDLAATSWLGRVPNGYLTLDRDAGEFFLRCRSATFPGQMIAELFGVGPGPLREEIDNNILHLDGDRHRRLRNLLNPFFTPRAADRWRETMRAIIDDICAEWIGAGRCEFVARVAKPYPAQVIATVVGAPRDDWPMLHEWSHWMQSQFDGPALLNDRERIERAVVEFYDWCDALLSKRRSAPADDLVSMLIGAAANEKLSAVELRNLVLDVIAGGVDTTHAQLAHALRLFAEHPDQWELLARTPALAPQAVEEVLRHEPVTPFGARILTADVTYRDVTFPAGTVMLIGAAVANREKVDDTFDINRRDDANRILTFGAGTHFCVGANLARAELEEALTYLAPRMRGLRLDGPPEFGTVQGIYGLPSLPLAWDTADDR
ncbi:MAG TPA: cytochrome P450 [Mycobacteriales bacterium]|nr:cytochrome P450 [Mycobacteriales bacterium]